MRAFHSTSRCAGSRAVLHRRHSMMPRRRSSDSMVYKLSCARSRPARALSGLLVWSLPTRRCAASTRSRARSRSTKVYWRGFGRVFLPGRRTAAKRALDLPAADACQSFCHFSLIAHRDQVLMPAKCVRLTTFQTALRFFSQCSHNISWSISSIKCGTIPNSPSPAMSGLNVLSICISSTWFRVIGGLANISAIQADACQAANGTGINMG